MPTRPLQWIPGMHAYLHEIYVQKKVSENGGLSNNKMFPGFATPTFAMDIFCVGFLSKRIVTRANTNMQSLFKKARMHA